MKLYFNQKILNNYEDLFKTLDEEMRKEKEVLIFSLRNPQN